MPTGCMQPLPHATTAPRNHWEQNTCNGEWLYLCKPGWTPSNCQGVTTAEVSAIQTLWRSPDISHQSATTKCMLGKKAGPKVLVRFINMKQKDAAKKVAAALPPRVLKDGTTKKLAPRTVLKYKPAEVKDDHRRFTGYFARPNFLTTLWRFSAPFQLVDVLFLPPAMFCLHFQACAADTTNTGCG